MNDRSGTQHGVCDHPVAAWWFICGQEKNISKDFLYEHFSGRGGGVKIKAKNNFFFYRFFAAPFRPFVRPGSVRPGSDRAGTRRMAKKL